MAEEKTVKQIKREMLLEAIEYYANQGRKKHKEDLRKAGKVGKIEKAGGGGLGAKVPESSLKIEGYLGKPVKLYKKKKKKKKSGGVVEKAGGGMTGVGLYPAEMARAGTMSQAKRKRYMKKGGGISYKMSGGQVVSHGYDK